MVARPRGANRIALLLGLLTPLTSLSCGWFAAERTPTDPKAIVDAIGANGLCVLIGLPDPGVAVRLAKASGLTIYVQTTSADQERQARQAAGSAGLLGRRIFVDQVAPGRVLLADNLADGVVAEPGVLAGEAGQRELTRILRPRGHALVGKRVITKPAPGGTDSWSHPYHGPDNNPLSTDALARAPFTTQFLAEPLFSSQPEVTVAAGGRLFKAFGHMTFRAYQNPMINTLIAMSAYNGTLLWTRPLKDGFMIHRNTMIATPDTLYLADDVSCKLIDAATGTVTREIVAPADRSEGPVWKWMALEGDVLYALLGPTEVAAPVAKGTETRIGGWPWDMWPGYDYKDPHTAWGFGKSLVALDVKTGAPLWDHHEDEPLDARGVCMAAGRIYFFCPGKFLGCVDARTGRRVWKTSDPAVLDAIGPNEKAQFYITGFATTAYMKCHNDMLMFAGPQRRSLLGVSAVDGKLLWQKKGGNFQLVLRDDAVYALGEQNGKSYKLDYQTGKVLTEFVGRRACTRATGTVDSVFCRATEGTIRWDVATDRLQHIAPMRPACHDGVVVSDGMLYWGPWICGCHLTLVGTICLTPAGGPVAAPAADRTPLLAQHRPDVRAVKPLPVDAADWPAYQADSQHSRTTRAAVPASVDVAWVYTPPAPLVPTAPVAAGGLVLVAGSDGQLHALDAASGRPRWEAATAGSVFFPPAIAQGRAYVGSNDGRVYAFEAATGAELWRFQAAPADRVIPVYGELVSTWPVAGGVVVEGGVVYAAAGISHFDGAHVYALDAVTGQVQWHNGDSGIVDPDVQNGISLCGSLRLDGGELSFPGGNVYATAVYDARTGQCRNKPAGPHTTRRIFLWPRKLWEPIDADDLAAPQGQVRVRTARNGRQIVVSVQPPGSDKPAWTADVLSYGGAAATANALLVLARTAEQELGQPVPQWLMAYNWKDGSVLWSRSLPASAVQHGLAVDAHGRVVVALEDGRVVCFTARDVPHE
jgi:outer membrane protein assembly factor BamB